MAAKIANSCKQLRPVKFPLRSLVLRTFYSSKSLENMGKITSFSNPEVQSLLKKLTGRNLDKIYAMRRGEFEVPSYKLMTDAEYLEVIFFVCFSQIYFLSGLKEQITYIRADTRICMKKRVHNCFCLY